MMTSSGRRVTTSRKRQATGEKPISPEPHISAALPAMIMAVRVGLGWGRVSFGLVWERGEERS